MATYTSLFNVEGTLGEVTFYKNGSGNYVRRKGGVSKERIMTDPAFARTRENLLEFANITTSSKQLRNAINILLHDAKDPRVSSRLTKIFGMVKNEDLTSLRGERTVAIGIASPISKAWFKGFNFNKNAALSSVLLTQFTLDTATGEINIPNVVTSQEVAVPGGATHISFVAGFLNLDFATDAHDLQLSPVFVAPVGVTPTTITLTPTAPPIGTGNNLYFLKIAFFQEINGFQYPLNNGAFNALQLIEML